MKSRWEFNWMLVFAGLCGFNIGGMNAILMMILVVKDWSLLLVIPLAALMVIWTGYMSRQCYFKWLDS